MAERKSKTKGRAAKKDVIDVGEQPAEKDSDEDEDAEEDEKESSDGDVDPDVIEAAAAASITSGSTSPSEDSFSSSSASSSSSESFSAGCSPTSITSFLAARPLVLDFRSAIARRLYYMRPPRWIDHGAWHLPHCAL